MLFQCWPTVFDVGPTLKQHRVNDPCLLGISFNLLAAEGGTSPVFVYKNGESSSFISLYFISHCHTNRHDRTDILSHPPGGNTQQWGSQCCIRQSTFSVLYTVAGFTWLATLLTVTNRLWCWSTIRPTSGVYKLSYVCFVWPSKQDMLSQLWINIGPASQTMDQY